MHISEIDEVKQLKRKERKEGKRKKKAKLKKTERRMKISQGPGVFKENDRRRVAIFLTNCESPLSWSILFFQV